MVCWSSGGTHISAARSVRLKIAIVGCGTGGQAASILLARAGHDVRVFERAPVLAPVGAGLLVQPTGASVLGRIGVGEELRKLATPIERLHGVTHRGRVVMDLCYRDLRPDLVGLGLQRSAISAALLRVMDDEGVELTLGTPIVRAEGCDVVSESGERFGGFDLVVGADGARSALRAQHAPLVRRDRAYAWGALWFVGEDPEGRYGRDLAQVYRGTRTMLGFLPSGRTQADDTRRVSVFWSVPASSWRGHHAVDLEGWKREVRALTDRADPLLEQIDDPERLIFAPYRDVVLKRPHEGRVAFIGDAAHAMSPQLGQGVNLALLDASALADGLARCDGVEEGLRAYARARARSVAYYQFASRWLTPVFQSDRTPVGWGRDALMGPAGRLGVFRNQMLLSLTGIKTGVLSRSELPDEQ